MSFNGKKYEVLKGSIDVGDHCMVSCSYKNNPYTAHAFYCVVNTVLVDHFGITC